MSGKHLEKVRELFERYDTDKDNSLDMNELAVLLSEIGSKLTALPAVSRPSRF
jgi:Ca2+-binding EF-hand superfamily protein